MLPVGSRLSPIDRPGRIGDLGAVERDVLAVALHRQLLKVRGKALQVLLVRQDRNRLSAEEVRVPHRQQAQEHGEVLVERSGAEVLVHLVEAVQRSEEHTSELQSRQYLVCRLLLDKKKSNSYTATL